MSTENTTIRHSSAPRFSRPLRLVNAHHAPLPAHHARAGSDRFSDTISRDDTRWVFAANVQMRLEYGHDGDHQSIIDTGHRMGLSDLQSRAIIAIVEEARARGGLDRSAMRQLLEVPAPDNGHELSDRARWLTFGVLFAWALLIAFLMQLV